MRSLGSDNQRLETTNEELMSTSFHRKTVVGKSVGKLMKTVPTQFVRMTMFMRPGITK